MSWFDILKRIDFQQDWTVTPERTNFEPAAPIPTPPQRQATKITSREKAIREKSPLEIKDEDLDCPMGTLWCDKHEECEPEKEWLTHNRHMSAEEILNQKQWGGTGGKGQSGGQEQQVSQKVKTR